MPLVNNSVTRFPNGVTNVGPDSIFNSLKVPDPTCIHSFYEDFDRYLASNWVVTVIGTTPTAALVDGNGGLLALTGTAVDNDGISLQSVKEDFFPVAGQQTFMKARFKLSDATQMDFMIGLAITDTTPLDATDGIYFIKADDAATISAVVRKDATTGSNTAVVGTLANDTFVTVEGFYDGVDRFYYGLNGSIIGYLDASAAFLPDAGLAPTIAMLNGEAVSKIATVDYIFVAQSR